MTSIKSSANAYHKCHRHSVGTDAPQMSTYFQLKIILDTDPEPVTTFPAHLSDFLSLVRHIKERVIPLRYPLESSVSSSSTGSPSNNNTLPTSNSLEIIEADDGEILSPTDRNEFLLSGHSRTLRSNNDDVHHQPVSTNTSMNKLHSSSRVLSQIFYWDIPLQQYRLLRSLQPLIDNGHQGQLYIQTVAKKSPHQISSLQKTNVSRHSSVGSSSRSSQSSASLGASPSRERTLHKMVNRNNHFENISIISTRERRGRKGKPKRLQNDCGYASATSHTSDAPSSVPIEEPSDIMSRTNHHREYQKVQGKSARSDNDPFFPTRPPPPQPLQNVSIHSNSKMVDQDIRTPNPLHQTANSIQNVSIFDVVSPPTIRKRDSPRKTRQYNIESASLTNSRQTFKNTSKHVDRSTMDGITLLERDAVEGYLSTLTSASLRPMFNLELKDLKRIETEPDSKGNPPLVDEVATKIPSKLQAEVLMTHYESPKMLFFAQNGTRCSDFSSGPTLKTVLKKLEKVTKRKVKLMEETIKRLYILSTLTSATTTPRQQDRTATVPEAVYNQNQRLSVLSKEFAHLRAEERVQKAKLRALIQATGGNGRALVIVDTEGGCFSHFNNENGAVTLESLLAASAPPSSDKEEEEIVTDNRLSREDSLRRTLLWRNKKQLRALAVVLKGTTALVDRLTELVYNLPLNGGSPEIVSLLSHPRSIALEDEEENHFFSFTKTQTGVAQIGRHDYHSVTQNDPFSEATAVIPNPHKTPLLPHVRMFSNVKIKLPTTLGLTHIRHPEVSAAILSSTTTSNLFEIPSLPISASATLALSDAERHLILSNISEQSQLKDGNNQKPTLFSSTIAVATVMEELCDTQGFILTLCQLWKPKQSAPTTNSPIVISVDNADPLRINEEIERYYVHHHNNYSPGSASRIHRQSPFIVVEKENITPGAAPNETMSMQNPLLSLSMSKDHITTAATPRRAPPHHEGPTTVILETSFQMGQSLNPSGISADAIQWNPIVKPSYLVQCKLSVNTRPTIDIISKSVQNGCSVHQGRPLNVWCRHCHLVICDLCASSGGEHAREGLLSSNLVDDTESVDMPFAHHLRTSRAIQQAHVSAESRIADGVDTLVPILFPSELGYLKAVWDDKITAFLSAKGSARQSDIGYVRTSNDLLPLKKAVQYNDAPLKDVVPTTIHQPSEYFGLPFNITSNILSLTGTHSPVTIGNAADRYVDSVSMAMNTSRLAIFRKVRALTKKSQSSEKKSPNNAESLLRIAAQFADLCGWEATSLHLMPLLVQTKWDTNISSYSHLVNTLSTAPERFEVAPYLADIEDLLSVSTDKESSSLVEMYNKKQALEREHATEFNMMHNINNYQAHHKHISSLDLRAKYKPRQLKRMFDKIQDILPQSIFDTLHPRSESISSQPNFYNTALGLASSSTPLATALYFAVGGNEEAAQSERKNRQMVVAIKLASLIKERIANVCPQNDEFSSIGESTRSWMAKTSLLGAAEHRLSLIEGCITCIEKAIISASNAIGETYRIEGSISHQSPQKVDSNLPFGENDDGNVTPASDPFAQHPYSDAESPYNFGNEGDVGESLAKIRRSVKRVSNGVSATQIKMLEAWREQVKTYQQRLELEMLAPLREVQNNLVLAVECVKELAIEVVIAQYALQPTTEQLLSISPVGQTLHLGRDRGSTDTGDAKAAAAAHQQAQLKFLASVSRLFECLKTSKILLLLAEKRYQSTVLVEGNLTDAETIKQWDLESNNEDKTTPQMDKFQGQNSPKVLNSGDQSHSLLTLVKHLAPSLSPASPLYEPFSKATRNFTQYSFKSLEAIVRAVMHSNELTAQLAGHLGRLAKSIAGVPDIDSGNDFVRKFLAASATAAIQMRIKEAIMPSISTVRVSLSLEELPPPLYLPSRVHDNALSLSLKPLKQHFALRPAITPDKTSLAKPMISTSSDNEAMKKRTNLHQNKKNAVYSNGLSILDRILQDYGQQWKEHSQLRNDQGQARNESSDFSSDSSFDTDDIGMVEKIRSSAIPGNASVLFPSATDGSQVELITTKEKEALASRYQRLESLLKGHVWIVPDIAQLLAPRQRVVNSITGEIMWTNETMILDRQSHFPVKVEQRKFKTRSLKNKRVLAPTDAKMSSTKRTSILAEGASPSAMRGSRPFSLNNSSVRVVSPRSMPSGKQSLEKAEGEGKTHMESPTVKLSSSVLRQHTKKVEGEGRSGRQISHTLTTTSGHQKRRVSVDARSSITNTSGMSSGSNGSRKQRERLRTIKELRRRQPSVSTQLATFIFGKPKLSKMERLMVFEGKQVLVLKKELRSYFRRYYTHAVGVLSDQYELARERQLERLEVNSVEREFAKTKGSEEETSQVISASLPYPLLQISYLALPQKLSVLLLNTSTTSLSTASLTVDGANTNEKIKKVLTPPEKLLKSILRDVNKNKLDTLTLSQLKEVKDECLTHIKRQNLTLALTGGNIAAPSSNVMSSTDTLQMARRRSRFGTFDLLFTEHPSPSYVVPFDLGEATIDTRINDIATDVANWFGTCCRADIKEDDANGVNSLLPFSTSTPILNNKIKKKLAAADLPSSSAVGLTVSPPQALIVLPTSADQGKYILSSNNSGQTPSDPSPLVAGETEIFGSESSSASPSSQTKLTQQRKIEQLSNPLSRAKSISAASAISNPRQRKQSKNRIAVLQQPSPLNEQHSGPHEEIPTADAASSFRPESSSLIGPKATPSQKFSKQPPNNIGEDLNGERSMSGAPSSSTCSRKIVLRKKMMSKPAGSSTPPLYPAAATARGRQLLPYPTTLFASATPNIEDSSILSTPKSIQGQPSSVTSPFLSNINTNNASVSAFDTIERTAPPRTISANDTPVNSPYITAQLADGTIVYNKGLKAGGVQPQSTASSRPKSSSSTIKRRQDSSNNSNIPFLKAKTHSSSSATKMLGRNQENRNAKLPGKEALKTENSVTVSGQRKAEPHISTTTLNLSSDHSTTGNNNNNSSTRLAGEGDSKHKRLSHSHERLSDSLAVSAVHSEQALSAIGNATANTSVRSSASLNSEHPQAISSLPEDRKSSLSAGEKGLQPADEDDHTPDLLAATTPGASKPATMDEKPLSMTDVKSNEAIPALQSNAPPASFPFHFDPLTGATKDLSASSPTFLNVEIPPVKPPRRRQSFTNDKSNLAPIFSIGPPSSLLQNNPQLRIEVVAPPEIYSEPFYLCGYPWELKLTCNHVATEITASERSSDFVSIYLCPINHSARIDYKIVLFGSRFDNGASPPLRYEIWSEYVVNGWAASHRGLAWGLKPLEERERLLRWLVSKEAPDDMGVLKLCVVPLSDPY